MNIFTAVITLGRDGEVRFIPSGKAVLSVTGAFNSGFGDRKQTHWLDCSLWGQRAEGDLVNYCKKGAKIAVSGELSTREYQAKDGTTKNVLQLNCNVFDLVGGKQEQAPMGQRGQAEKKQPVIDSYNSDDYDDSLPF